MSQRDNSAVPQRVDAVESCLMRVLYVNETYIKLDPVRPRSRLGLLLNTKRPKTQYTCLMERKRAVSVAVLWVLNGIGPAHELLKKRIAFLDIDGCPCVQAVSTSLHQDFHDIEPANLLNVCLALVKIERWILYTDCV